MTKKTPVEDTLAALRALEGLPLAAEDEKRIRDAIASRNRELVATAARTAHELSLDAFCGDLARAFAYFLENPARDKGCIAKCALVDALDALQCDDDDLYAAGLRHVQMEPVWGGKEDTAAALRVKCAFALVRRNVPGVLFPLAELVNDPMPEARRGAIRAVAHVGGQEAELMLRVLAWRLPDPEDLSECLNGLMECQPERSLPFVARFLDHEHPAVAESAALAMGASRQAEAFEVLRRRWEQTVSPGLRDMLLLPIALIRNDAALEFLLAVVREGHAAAAESALEAMGIYRDDPVARKAIGAAVRERGERRVREAYDRVFEPC